MANINPNKVLALSGKRLQFGGMKEKPTAPVQAQHSPLPWTMDATLLKSPSGRTYKSNAVIANGKLVGQLVGFSESDAALVLRAVNNDQRLADARASTNE